MLRSHFDITRPLQTLEYFVQVTLHAAQVVPEPLDEPHEGAVRDRRDRFRSTSRSFNSLRQNLGEPFDVDAGQDDGLDGPAGMRAQVFMGAQDQPFDLVENTVTIEGAQPLGLSTKKKAGRSKQRSRSWPSGTYS